MSLTAELDRVEGEARDEGSDEPLLAAALIMGFRGGWPEIIRLARGVHRHPAAIELLCRRVERGL